MKPGCLVLGAGGHAKVVLACLEALELPVAGVLDDTQAKWGTELLGVPVLGPLGELAKLARPAVIAIGGNAARRAIHVAHPEGEWLTVVHPHAWVHRSVLLGAGTVVFAGAMIQPDARIGLHGIVNTGATVDHDCDLGDWVHVAPGCHLAGSVRLGDGVFMGIGSAAVPGSCVGPWTTVGAGGVVVHNLPGSVVALGTPARPRT